MFDDNNDFSLAAARVLFLLVATSQLARTKLVKWGFGLAVPLTIICVISTFSRGGFLALAAGAFAFALLQRRRIVAVSALVLIAVIVGLTVPIPEGYFERLNTIRTYQEDEENSALGRLHYWQTAVQMVGEHPFGVGLKNFEANYDSFDTSDGRFGTRRAVHSTYFQTLSELGYPGFMAYLVIVGLVLHTLFRIRRRARVESLSVEDRRFCLAMSNALIASTVAFAVGSAFASAFLNDLNWFTFAYVTALDRVSASWETAPAGLPSPARVVAEP